MNKRVKISAVSLVIYAFVFLLGLGIGRHFELIKLKLQKFTIHSSLKDYDFSRYWEVYYTLKNKYVDPSKIDDQKLYYGTIKGMVNAVGDYATVFLDPKENAEYKKSLSAEYEGIGIMIDVVEKTPHVASVFEGAPAQKAGLKPGDFIVKVNDTDVIGMPLYKVVKLIKGKAGTVVKLTIVRPSEGRRFVVKVTRGVISAPSIQTEVLPSGIFKFRVLRFTESTPVQWQLKWSEAVEKFHEAAKAGKVKGIIVDLRGNPGGFFSSAVYFAEDFLPPGKVVAYQKDRNGIRSEYKTSRDPRIPSDIPLVILVNHGTASAAEIVTGALQYYKRAYVIGESTFGKGTVQKPIDYPDGSSLHLTVYKWLLPNKEWLNKENPIKPDKEVKFDHELWDKQQIDNQIKAAEEYLKSKMR